MGMFFLPTPVLLECKTHDPSIRDDRHTQMEAVNSFPVTNVQHSCAYRMHYESTDSCAIWSWCCCSHGNVWVNQRRSAKHQCREGWEAVGSGPGVELCVAGHVIVLARADCGGLIPAKEALSHDPNTTECSHQEADRCPYHTKVKAQTRVVGEMSISEYYNKISEGVWVLFGSFFMFSNFYRLISHTQSD